MNEHTYPVYRSAGTFVSQTPLVAHPRFRFLPTNREPGTGWFKYTNLEEMAQVCVKEKLSHLILQL